MATEYDPNNIYSHNGIVKQFRGTNVFSSVAPQETPIRVAMINGQSATPFEVVDSTGKQIMNVSPLGVFRVGGTQAGLVVEDRADAAMTWIVFVTSDQLQWFSSTEGNQIMRLSKNGTLELFQSGAWKTVAVNP